MKRKIALLLLLILVAIQFIRPARNSSAVVPAHQMSAVVTMPDSIQKILKVSCYDCHSNNTVYPWYSQVQPVAWWLSDHINDGKRGLNFDEFATYKVEKMKHRLKDIAETVQEGEMPLKSYLIIHKDAELSEVQKKQLIDWASSASEELQKRN